MKTYIRFGKMPSSCHSINFNRLNNRENETFTDLLNSGYTLEQALIEAVGSERASKVVEDGVSVFETDTDGFPKIENLQQAMSLVSRIGRETFRCTGKEVGIGHDDEPLIIPETSEKITFSSDDLIEKIENVLRANYKRIINTDPAYTASIPHIYQFTYTDWTGKEHRYEDGTKYVFFKGKEYSDPVESWNEKTGADRK